MNSKTKPFALRLGVAVFLLYLIKPHWFDHSLIGLILVASTVFLTTICVLSLLIKTIKPALFPISGTEVARDFLGSGLLILISIKLGDVFPVYTGIALGMLLFAFAWIFQRDRITA
jgi:hypothetical protein